MPTDGLGVKVRRRGRLVLGLALLFLPAAARPQGVSSPIPLKIDANEWDARLLLEKLNKHGSFARVESGYTYVVKYETTRDSSGFMSGYPAGVATVCNAEGRELFRVEKLSGFGEGKATDHVAKEIAKRLKKKFH